VLLCEVVVAEEISAGIVGAIPNGIFFKPDYLLQSAELSLDELDSSQHGFYLQLLQIQPTVDVVGLIHSALFCCSVLVG
jgi:ammonia channel protein AmtB